MVIRKEQKAEALVDTLYEGAHIAARRYNVAVRTIRNWQRDLQEDEELYGLFEYKRHLREENWAGEIPDTLRSAMGFIRRAAQEANPEDPKAIAAMARALKVIGEIALTKEILDARLNELSRPAIESPEPLDASWREEEFEGSYDEFQAVS